MAEIRVERVSKLFKNVRAIDDVSLTVADGEFMVLLGPSGCGKTTLLRSIAGLEQIDGGRIVIGDRDVTDLPPRKRNIAMVFQSYAVFPHMTVFENIAFGLRMRKTSKADVTKRLDLHDIDAGQREWVVRLGRLGHAARGVVFGIVGWFLVRAAMNHDPAQAGGLGDALASLQAAPYGRWLLGLVALGLVAYGLFNVVRARYRTIDV